MRMGASAACSLRAGPAESDDCMKLCQTNLSAICGRFVGLIIMCGCVIVSRESGARGVPEMFSS